MASKTETTRDDADLGAILPAERSRLVRLCAHLTGDAASAEDLAQETLLEAWRHRGKLHDAGGYQAWLTAIARNVCRRWQRAHYQQQARSRREIGDAIDILGQSLADDFALEIELERQELADLLDRAMALLPGDVRTVLVERYIRESSHLEIAERLGLSEGAARIKAHRGKIALERILRERFGEEALSYGLGVSDQPGWDQSRIWCPVCGRRRLSVRFISQTGEFTARCPVCHEPDLTLTDVRLPDVLRGVTGRKAALNRLLAWNHAYISDALTGRPVSCPACTRVGRAAVERGERGSRPVESIRTRCSICRVAFNWELAGFALTLPEGRRFWKEQPRIRTLPSYDVDAAGTPGLVTRFESVTGASYLDVVVALDSVRVLGVYGPVTHTAGDD